MPEISAAARQELVQAVGHRYREGTADAKRRILDEFVVLIGYHRKHATRVLNGVHRSTGLHEARLRLYDVALDPSLHRLPLGDAHQATETITTNRIRSALT